MTFSERAEEAGLKAYNNAIDALSGDTSGALYSLDDIRRHGLKAALTAALAVDGLALVPTAPREKMVLEGADVLLKACASDKGHLRPWKPFDVAQVAVKTWTVMLTAASDGEVKPSDSSGSEG